MDKRENILPAVFIAVILAMCLLPSVGMVLFGPSETGANEILAQKPEISDELGFNFAVLQDTASYVEDRFFARQELITAGRKLSAGVFGAINSESVTVGRDGWLFYGETMDDYAGVNGLSDRELFAAAKNVALMEEYCRESGIDFVFTVAPNKNSLYPEYMRGPLKAGERDSLKLYGLMDSMGISFLDLFEVFEERDEVLYFAHDSHWTGRGAALGADAINGALGRASDYFSGDFTSESHTGDLYEMAYPASADRERDLVPTDPPEFSYGSGGTRPDSITINTESAAGGVLLCYRDSFGNSLYPYLAASFGRARFSRSPQYDMLLADELGADAVVVELVERNIGYLLDHPPVVYAPARDVELPGDRLGELRVFAENADTRGWATVAGTLPAEPDADSPVYIANAGGVYEAVLTRDGFTALVPAAGGPWSLAFFMDGRLVVYNAV